MEAPDTLTCCDKKHHLYGSIYPRDAVPLIKFLKDPNVATSAILSTCLDCRRYKSTVTKRYYGRLKKKSADSKSEFSLIATCQHTGHSRYSIHPRDAVPIELFRMIEDNPKSHLAKMCKDCRTELARIGREKTIRLEERAKDQNKFACSGCHHIVDLDQRASNLDGTLATVCLKCKDRERMRRKETAELFNTLRCEFMLKYQSSCFKCNRLYIYDNSSDTLFQFETSERDGARYVEIAGEELKVVDVIVNTPEYLELEILHFDHLTEAEQRERGLLKPDEPFIPKYLELSAIASEKTLRLESLKCQLLCARCHVEETIARENPDVVKYPTDKQKYIDSIKIKGCGKCGYQNTSLLRFFHMDHLDPATKINKVSSMVNDKDYSMQDVIDECDKCRVLCAHCHIIHTRNQRKAGII